MGDKVDTTKLLTVARAARELGLSRRTLYRWVEAKEIKSHEVDGVLFIPKEEVARIKTARAPRGQGPSAQPGKCGTDVSL
jgi:excisionase family DNA binding protein